MINQLVKIYYSIKWNKTYLSEIEARKYFQCLINKDRIICSLKDNEVVGYIEWWNIKDDQLLRALYSDFHIGEEDIESGDICLVSDVWIKEGEKDVWKYLKNELFKRNRHCKFFIGKEIKRGRRIRKYGSRKRYYGKSATTSTDYNLYTDSRRTGDAEVAVRAI